MSAKAAPATFSVRPALAADATGLLQQMRELAAFEGYLAEFRVTIDDLLTRGLGHEPAQFHALLAESADGVLLGYAVLVETPFTFDLQADCRLKELYVSPAARSMGVGKALMNAVLAHARLRGCGRLKWDVLPDNENARQFYRNLGGQPDINWEAWILAL
ncbi:GNAT family N-acetyltransferase [Undibacterium umbellatum]|uniref:GNAT family N-acetyltransferase n=1 Tax=Undibacterium umbellatum TaxID=2762300 RepID=A0ABR6ZA30_9BURK|nr:GNAT family N-acetyltransferase [Undibacterium umbellatum]MBC3908616.1 GNAT family N-acetyltransferase [Undibacterium umbellatum]